MAGSAQLCFREKQEETVAIRNVVVSGAGVVSPFGIGRERFFKALQAGESAVGEIHSFDARTFPTRIAAQVTDELPEQWRDRKVGFAWLAAQEAWKQAGCTPKDSDAWICLGLGLEQAFLEDFAPYCRVRSGSEFKMDWEQINSDYVNAKEPSIHFRSEVDLSVRVLSERLGTEGPVIVNSSACAAGTMSIAEAATWIRRGWADLVICGGADSMINPLGVGGMSRLGAPSPRDSSDACRPFSRQRDGLVMGEGAAVFILEEESRALGRGVKPLARVLGWGVTQDGYRVTAPRPDGKAAARAMRRAIEMAGILPQDIGYINAHGTGTPLNDPAESKAICEVFGDSDFRISSVKGAVGHLMAASGAIEFAACLLPFMRGFLPGTAHLTEPDPELGIHIVSKLIGPEPLRQSVDFALSNSFGFGGQNASIVMGRYL